jgi:hypothetical protein
LLALRLQSFAQDSGSLSTYIAASMVLPLLLLLVFLGVSLSGLIYTESKVDIARDAAVLQAEIQGGVTPQVVSSVDSMLQSLGVPGTWTVSGTPAPVPWGQPIQLTVTDRYALYGFPWDILGMQGDTVVLGGTVQATSNRSP